MKGEAAAAIARTGQWCWACRRDDHSAKDCEQAKGWNARRQRRRRQAMTTTEEKPPRRHRRRLHRRRPRPILLPEQVSVNGQGLDGAVRTLKAELREHEQAATKIKRALAALGS
jgi:hypothetical protein